MPPNSPPTFAPGPDETVREDSGAFSATWATAISPGPPADAGQNVTFSVVNDNAALFSSVPDLAPDGTLTFTAADNANGAATVTVTAHDDGGTANGGSDTSAPHSFTLTIDRVNDPPSFTAGPDQTVLSALGAQTVPGWADHGSLFSVQPDVASDGTLTYTPALLALGSATVTVRARDDGGSSQGGDDTSPPQTFTITIL